MWPPIHSHIPSSVSATDGLRGVLLASLLFLQALGLSCPSVSLQAGTNPVLHNPAGRVHTAATRRPMCPAGGGEARLN